MVNVTNKPCIISTHEAQALAAGDSLALAVLSDDLCPALRQTDVAILQEQFKKVIESPIKAMAYLWRPESVEAIRADQSLATLETCQDIATPVRCEVIKAYAEGRMSQMMIEEEVGATGVAKCDWRTRLAEHDRAWLNYVNVNKSYRERNTADALGQLLGTLILMSEFVTYSGVVFEENSSAQDMACSQKVDCDVVSTHVIDQLRQVGQTVSGEISVVEIPQLVGKDYGHVTLQIADPDDGSLYFDNAIALLSGTPYQGKSRTVDPWQVTSSFYIQLGQDLSEKDNFSVAVTMFQKAQELNPQNSDSYVLGALLLSLQGDIEGGLNKTQKALVLDPQNASAHFFLGWYLLAKEDITGAIAECKMGLALRPNIKKAHHMLASIYYQRGDVEGAISELKAELANDPKNTDASESLADLMRWKWLYKAKAKLMSL